MVNRNIIIASHSHCEAITQFVRNNKRNLKDNISIVLLAELLHEYEIFDELSDATEFVSWHKGNKTISNKTHLLLNRVSYVPDDLFLTFDKVDREYAQREFEAYIGFSFNTFIGVGNKHPTGSCEEIISLPQQWNVIKNYGINAPNYYIGPINFNTSLDGNRLVYSSIFNFLNWSSSSEASKDSHVFCFERPLGYPLFILCIGTKHFIMSNMGFSEVVSRKIDTIIDIIRKVIGYFVAEILIFIDDENITFGCINPEIIMSCKYPIFEELLYKNLFGEFEKCMS